MIVDAENFIITKIIFQDCVLNEAGNALAKKSIE